MFIWQKLQTPPARGCAFCRAAGPTMVPRPGEPGRLRAAASRPRSNGWGRGSTISRQAVEIHLQARFRLYRHRLLQQKTRFPAFFLDLQHFLVEQLQFGNFFADFTINCEMLADISPKSLIFN